MKWQEYQEAVAVLYENLEGTGKVMRNVYLPDVVTGQKRQIDVMIELSERGHLLRILIDAKYYATPLDVKIVESVLALSAAVGANKTIIVAANGFTTPAIRKAKNAQCDLMILSLEQALDLLVPDKWVMCQVCNADCVILDQCGVISSQEGKALWWLAGKCRECGSARIHCQGCGMKSFIEIEDSVICGCGYEWHNKLEGISIDLRMASDES